MDFKKLAFEAEEKFDFAKALEYYEKAYDQLSIEDGSLDRYAKLLFDFQQYEKAREIFKLLHEKTKDEEYLKRIAEIDEILNEDALELFEVKSQERIKPSSISLGITPSLVRKFLDLFSGREDVFAYQTEQGYYPVRRKMNSQDVVEHLEGQKTLGVYVLRSDNSVKFCAFDVDLKKDLSQDYSNSMQLCRDVVVELRERLKLENIKNYVEFSGNKGYHVWIFFDRWIQAYKVRFVLKSIAESLSLHEEISVEIFPKQSDHEGGLGNLIKLPLGIHKKTSNRCVFVDENFEPIKDQFKYLLEIECNSADEIEKLYKEMSEKAGSIQLDEPKRRTRNQTIKKTIRKQIRPQTEQAMFNAVIQACYPLKQIAAKIEKQAYITEDEEYILIASCAALNNSTQLLSQLLQKTINYSQSRLLSILSRVGNIPMTCEEIKRYIISKSLPLSIDQCSCKFDGPINTPLCFVLDCRVELFKNASVQELVNRIIEKTREKNELERYIKSLRSILASKMSSDEITVNDVIVRKTSEGDVQIII